MEVIRSWLSAGVAGIKQSALASNTILLLIQLTLEKILEKEFVCPCVYTWNRLYASAVLVFPSIITVLLVCSFKCKRDSFKSFKSFWEVFPFCFVPPITWLIIVFIDGRYFACAMTSWSGKYVDIDKSPMKICQVEHQYRFELAEVNTQLWYAQSQFIGFCMVLVLTVLYSVGQISISCYDPSSQTNSDGESRAKTSRIYNPSVPVGSAWQQAQQVQYGNQHPTHPNVNTHLLYQHPQTVPMQQQMVPKAGSGSIPGSGGPCMEVVHLNEEDTEFHQV